MARRAALPGEDAGKALKAPETKPSVPPGSAAGRTSPDDPVPFPKVLELLDRLSGAEEAAFVATWLESLSYGRLPPALGVRLLRALRETGRTDRVRELLGELPAPPPSGWPAHEAARLSIERAMLAILDGRIAEAEDLRAQASRALGDASPGTGLREQLDVHLVAAEIELRRSDLGAAARSLRLAEHVAERMDDGAFRVAVSMSLGHLAMRLADPRAAAKHYREALDRAPSRGLAAMRAHANVAIALGSSGAFEGAREHADAASAAAAILVSGWRHADAYDVTALVCIAADRPEEAIVAVDTALGLLGENEQPTLRFQLSSHKTFALAAAGKAAQAKTWLARTERLKAEIGNVDAIDAQDLVATRARALEAQGQLEAALEAGLPHAAALPQAFVTGTLNLVLGRVALALGRTELASTCVERAALSGEKHGWVFPERRASAALYQLARKSGDSRVVRFAESMLGVTSSVRLAAAPDEPSSDAPVFVTTREGVTPVALEGIEDAVKGADLVVDTLAHELRVGDKRSSLERRRALEPLVVELLRRAKDGLSAEEILRAAGGPGPDSADAEHRVRVLVSRVRDLLGDTSLITRVRDAGEHGKTRYRLAEGVRFALVEPRER